jgi:uncharacterized repeat protein (TIGR03803 family)
MSIAKCCAIATLAVTAAAPLTANAGTFTTLYTFTGGADGGNPLGPIIYQGGALYGTSIASSDGDVFKLDVATGHFKNVYAFKGGADGGAPESGVIYQGGTLYGTASYGGGACQCGTIFAINPKTGAETTLYDFSQAGIGPASLVFLAGTLYGTTTYAGANGDGSVFSFNPTTGSFTTLHDFSGGTDGIYPYAQLVFQNGLLYGTTLYGGGGTCPHGGCGTLYTIDPTSGTETILHAFTNRHRGIWPTTNLVYYSGSFLGDSEAGGNIQDCKRGCGVNFAVNATTGAEKVLEAFDNLSEGYQGLAIVRGSLYATVPGGGGFGELVKVNLKSGQQTVLYTFTGGADGFDPVAPLVYHDGAFYGTTFFGANRTCEDGCGTIFKYMP